MSVAPERLHDSVRVERLQRVRGDERDALPARLELRGQIGRELHDGAVAEDAHVLAAPEVAELPECEGVDGARRQVRLARLAQPQVHGPVLLGHAVQRGLAALGRIARSQHRHVGERRGQDDVFLGVVRAAQRRVGDAPADPHELERPEQGERGDRVREGPHPTQGHARAEADHDLLGDAGVDEPLGELIAELLHRPRRGDVGDDDGHPLVVLARLVDRVRERVPHDVTSASSAMAFAYSSLFGER